MSASRRLLAFFVAVIVFTGVPVLGFWVEQTYDVGAFLGIGFLVFGALVGASVTFWADLRPLRAPVPQLPPRLSPADPKSA